MALPLASRAFVQIMHRCSVLLLSFLLAVGSASARVDLFEQLESFDIRENLRLLAPEQLLNYDIARKNGQENKNDCERDVVLYEEAIGRNESWAMRMLDSSSKVPSGILRGNIIDLGMYEECMAVQSSRIKGQYCTYSIRPVAKGFLFPIDARLAICLPDSCTDRDIIELLNGAINRSVELKELEVVVTTASCASSTVKELSRWDILLLFTVSIYTSFLIICTWLDVSERQSELSDGMQHKSSSTLVRFSMVRSVESIFNLKSQDGDLPFVHGIRVISTCWIALLHEYFIRVFGSINDLMTLAQWLTTWKPLIPLLGVLAVDTFLALSGFLVSYNFFRKMKKTNRFINIPLFYIHRYLRLTLPPMMILFLGMLVLPIILSGPQVKLKDIFFAKCSSKWWAILLYVYNLVDCENFCYLHLWSLSVDMQLYWISPFILYALYKKPKVGLTILGLLTLGSMLTKAALVAHNNHSAIYITHTPNISHIFRGMQEVYIQTYTRATPWLVGVYFGYELTNKNMKPTKSIITAGWSLATFAFIVSIGGTRYFILESYEYNIYWEALFAPFSKLCWSFGICWIIYACNYDAAGVITEILSWKYFRPLSKLSYCFYLVHIIFPTLGVMLSRTSVTWNDFFILHSYIGNVSLSFGAAFFTCIYFEKPMLVLDGLLFQEKIASYKKRNEAISNSIMEPQKSK